jgi:hypothetical protein
LKERIVLSDSEKYASGLEDISSGSNNFPIKFNKIEHNFNDIAINLELEKTEFPKQIKGKSNLLKGLNVPKKIILIEDSDEYSNVEEIPFNPQNIPSDSSDFKYHSESIQTQNIIDLLRLAHQLRKEVNNHMGSKNQIIFFDAVEKELSMEQRD